MKPRGDHPWYGKNNHARKGKTVRDELIDREIERAILLERHSSDVNDLDGDLKPSRDASYAQVDGGLRRMPVRYDDKREF